MAASGMRRLPDECRYFRNINRGYLDWARRMGFIAAPEPILVQLYAEPLQRLRLAAEGHGAVQPPEGLRPRLLKLLRSAAALVRAFEQRIAAPESFPLFRRHAATDGDVSLVGFAERLASADPRRNRLYINRATAERLELDDDDWVWIESPWGRVKGQLKLMEGVNATQSGPGTPIGKRAGAWNLDPSAPEAMRGFLLNHVISELLPGTDAQPAMANADPITGQAAWYDLRVRLAKVAQEETGVTEPLLSPLTPMLPKPPKLLRTGEWFRHRRRAGERP